MNVFVTSTYLPLQIPFDLYVFGLHHCPHCKTKQNIGYLQYVPLLSMCNEYAHTIPFTCNARFNWLFSQRWPFSFYCLPFLPLWPLAMCAKSRGLPPKFTLLSAFPFIVENTFFSCLSARPSVSLSVNLLMQHFFALVFVIYSQTNRSIIIPHRALSNEHWPMSNLLGTLCEGKLALLCLQIHCGQRRINKNNNSWIHWKV